MHKSLVRSVVRELITELRDDYMEFKHEWDKKTPQEQAKIWAGGLTEKQKSDIQHHFLDLLGFIPGPGDVADFLNASLYASEGQYFLAALSLICMFPVVGTAFGVVKISTKKIPANVARIIAENSSGIRTLTRRVVGALPNSDKVASAVEEILERAKFGDEIDLEDLGAAAKKAGEEKSASKQVGDYAEVWYKNPAWKPKIISLARPLITKVLNKVSTKTYRVNLIKNMTRRFTKQLRAVTSTGIGLEGVPIDAKEFVKFALERNNQLIKDVMFKLPEVINDVARTCEIRIVDDIAVANKLDSSGTALAQVVDAGSKVYLEIFLPRFSTVAIENLEATLENAIVHEIRHVVDSRLGKMFVGSGRLDWFSDALDMKDLFKTMSDKMDIPEKYIEYISNPREMWVRVDALRDFLGKEKIDVHDLINFIEKNRNNPDVIPNDIYLFFVAMKDISDEALEDIASAMNKVL